MDSLALIDPELSAYIRAKVQQPNLKDLCLNAVRLAIARIGLESPIIDQAIVEFSHDIKNSNTISKLSDLASEFDELYFQLQGKYDLGEAEESEYLKYFGYARVCQAILSAFGDDSLLSTLDCLYEAHSAIPEWDEVIKSTRSRLGLVPN